YVSPAYHLLEGFPFIQEPPSGDLQERVLIRHHDYDQCFQSVQLLQWNSQVKFNVTVYRNLRSEERFSRNAETDLVCRLLLEKKNCERTLFPDLPAQLRILFRFLANLETVQASLAMLALIAIVLLRDAGPN